LTEAARPSLEVVSTMAWDLRTTSGIGEDVLSAMNAKLLADHDRSIGWSDATAEAVRVLHMGIYEAAANKLRVPETEREAYMAALGAEMDQMWQASGKIDLLEKTKARSEAIMEMSDRTHRAARYGLEQVTRAAMTSERATV
jgi:proline dehydrogenase